MTRNINKAAETAEQSKLLKESFIANISHEIRTPLNGLLGLTEILREDYAQYIKPGDEYIFEGIKSSSERIIRTIDMILDFSQLRSRSFSLKPKPVLLSGIIKDSIKQNYEYARSKGITLLYNCNCEEKAIVLDEYTVRKAVAHLVDNAIKFTKQGHVRISLAAGEDKSYHVSVADTGIGIDGEYLQCMFEPFRQEKMGYGRPYEGVGLGLALTQEYFALNNAKLSVASKKGAGSVFTAVFKTA